MIPGRSSALARTLAVVYTLLVVYASLYPFTGWRDTGIPLFAFLGAGWPRWYSVFDIVVNVLAYIPLGFFWLPVITARFGRIGGIVFTCAMLSLLSGTMETIQNFLPSRVASNLDLACNSLGAWLGVLAAWRWSNLLLSENRLLRWRHRHLAQEPGGDYGVLLLGIWLFVQLSPEDLLFGNGNLRVLFDLPAALPFDAADFARYETLIALSGTLTIGLLASLVLRRPRGWHLLVLLAGAATIRSFAAALLVDPDNFTRWLTDANLAGMCIGALLMWPLLHLGEGIRRILAAMLVLATAALVNIAPDNPYLQQATQVWRQGHFLNFNGLTRAASSLWPFLTIAFLMWQGRNERG
ncbi:MAG TPA: VanZ family protein [Rhodocyclaceae bacterium]|nr:VanZ family protein [Rhodocyclaceae bacterium]